jgi:hypothetical protein
MNALIAGQVLQLSTFAEELKHSVPRANSYRFDIRKGQEEGILSTLRHRFLPFHSME